MARLSTHVLDTVRGGPAAGMRIDLHRIDVVGPPQHLLRELTMRWDAVIRGGMAVTPAGPVRADIALADGRIVEIAVDLAGAAGEEIDATGCHVLPGLIDPHVHFNDPGRAEWEGFATGSAALAADDATLWQGMQAAAGLGLPVLVHAENDAIPSALARARGVDVTCETCPDYLVLTEADAERLGAVAKCAPPLRSPGGQAELWAAVLAGNVEFIASDYSPAPASLKQSKNCLTVWGGIAGCQATLGLLLEEGHARRGMPLFQLARLTSANAAWRFSLSDRGRIEPGFTVVRDGAPVGPAIGQLVRPERAAAAGEVAR